MGKISNKVSKGLGDAIKEAQEKMTGNSNPEVEALLNSGAENRRKRKSKKEEQTVTEDNSLFNELIPKETKPEKVESHMKTYEEVCQEDIQKAHERGYEDPDFDFRDYYQKGQVIYYILILGGGINTKELKRLKVRTVYPRMLVCDEEKAACQCIGYSQRDYIFNTAHEAKPTYDSIDLATEEPVKVSKSKAKIEEEINEEEKTNDGPDLSSD